MNLREIISYMAEDANRNGGRYADRVMAPKAQIDSWKAEMEPRLRAKLSKSPLGFIYVHGVLVVEWENPGVALSRMVPVDTRASR